MNDLEGQIHQVQGSLEERERGDQAALSRMEQQMLEMDIRARNRMRQVVIDHQTRRQDIVSELSELLALGPQATPRELHTANPRPSQLGQGHGPTGQPRPAAVPYDPAQRYEPQPYNPTLPPHPEPTNFQSQQRFAVEDNRDWVYRAPKHEAAPEQPSSPPPIPPHVPKYAQPQQGDVVGAARETLRHRWQADPVPQSQQPPSQATQDANRSAYMEGDPDALPRFLMEELHKKRV